MSGRETGVYDVIVVGGGIAGLTACAFLVQSGLSVLLCEKEDSLGGLCCSYERNGFTYDGGARALIDSGIILPMLRQLGITMETVRNRVSLGIGEKIIPVVTSGNLRDYEDLLASFCPENREDIRAIIRDLRTVMKHMKVLYGIENPVFKDLRTDREYLLKVLLPWIGKFLLTIGKINRMNMPVEDHLLK